MTAYQWLGVLILAALLIAFIVHEGEEMGYGFVLGLLVGIVLLALIVSVALALIFEAIP